MTDLSIAPEPERRERVLVAALAVFARYGFRKTSMDEVARAADISRQGLYFLFDGKEALFRAALTKMMADGLAAVEAALAGPGPLDTRLTAAMTAWFGRTAGGNSATVDELLERSLGMLGEAMRRYGEAVEGRFVDAIAADPLAETLDRRGISARDAALTLLTVGEGLKHAALPRAEFTERLNAAVRLVCGT
jgi:AcrR family transcriptional regulator